MEQSLKLKNLYLTNDPNTYLGTIISFEKLSMEEVKINRVPTKNNIVDPLAKTLTQQKDGHTKSMDTELPRILEEEKTNKEYPYESFRISTSQEELVKSIPFIGDTITSHYNCNNHHDATDAIIPPTSSTQPVVTPQFP
ncbi:hypothetical protein MTR_0430s0040 [Medicago truncatula]|uniref:Uncharacterized protein n=1 Tax=Medicago truncatula TaxID=3880 RepID=A0A072TFF8_MEDTR|nr:hypothetical protein MTR_0430s0040 [Medicago truncatula]